MNFIHISDVHLGIVPDSNKPWSLDRAYDIKETFEKVINRCNETNCSLLLIAGDLFNRQPLTADLNEINELFKTIPKTHIVIVSGECDRIKDNSAVLSYEFNPNVHYILSNYPTTVEIPELNTIVHGFSYHDNELKRPMVDIIENPANDKKIHILLAHGGDSNHCPIDYTILANKNFSYCALGHIHNFTEVVKRKIIYSGSLEPLSFYESQEHGICIGDINPITCRIESFRFEQFSTVSYIPLNIKVQVDTTNEELITSISNEIYKRDSMNIYKLHITGNRNPEIKFDFSILNKSFKISEIIDDTQPQYDFVSLSKNHPNDMIGAFIRSFKSDDIENMSDIQKKALFYGIDALLKTSDKRD